MGIKQQARNKKRIIELHLEKIMTQNFIRQSSSKNPYH